MGTPDTYSLSNIIEYHNTQGNSTNKIKIHLKI